MSECEVHPGEFGDYFFYPSRVVASKRQIIPIEAMRYVKSPFKLIITGNADTTTYCAELQDMIERWGLQNRATMLGWILEPTPQALAEGMELLWTRRRQTLDMGENAFATLVKHQIEWDNVIEKLMR